MYARATVGVSLKVWLLQAFHQYIEPSMQFADIVVPQGAENKVAMDLIVHHVKDKLKKVSWAFIFFPGRGGRSRALCQCAQLSSPPPGGEDILSSAPP